MTPLLQIKNGSLSYGFPLLDHADFIIQANERVCLVGRNGTGKSTLLKVIDGSVKLDDGQLIQSSNIRVSTLPQDPPETIDISIFEYVSQGLADVGDLLNEYFYLTQKIAESHEQRLLDRLDQVQRELDHLNAWQFEQRINQILTQLKLPSEQSLSDLSGGWRRKAALARALVTAPDVLLLDEPTNHLDISMIQWLEQQVKEFNGAIVFVSHDRAFIRAIATRIVDLDRGKLTSYPGNYDTYLQKKAEDLEVENQQNQLFDKKLSQEETWIRQGIKARRTRNEGRVRSLKKLRQEFAERRNVMGKAKISLNDSKMSGKLVFEAQNIHYAYDQSIIVDDLDLTVLRGDKLALIGPNGCGKSTLLKLLMGQLQPQKGSVRQGTNLDIAYFDQHRVTLDPEKSVIDVVADGKREVVINGNSRHVISYLQDFLFTPDRANSPVKSLSGGEKNRLLLATLLSRPSNLLILDEPTNDLDVETLELLEDTLLNYPGTVILVSHDREFVDNVVTSSLAFEGQGKIQEFVGGYGDVLQWYKQTEKNSQKKETSKQSESPRTDTSVKRKKKLSYKFQQELEKLPGLIEELEEQTGELQETVNSPEFFKQDPAESNQILARLTEMQDQLENAYARWDELESMTQESDNS